MRKWVIILIMFAALFFMITTITNAKYNGILLKNTHIFDSLQLKSGHLLKEIIVLPEEAFDQNEARNIIHRLDELPPSILKLVKEKNMKIVLFNGKLTDNESAAHLSGKTPRGYPGTVTWDDVPGIGGSKLILVKIGNSEKGKGHGSVNLEYHELAHSLYHFVYNDKQTVARINSLWQKEANFLFPDQAYFLQYKEEYFAESFAYYSISSETRNKMKRIAPETFAFFADI